VATRCYNIPINQAVSTRYASDLNNQEFALLAPHVAQKGRVGQETYGRYPRSAQRHLLSHQNRLPMAHAAERDDIRPKMTPPVASHANVCGSHGWAGGAYLRRSPLFPAWRSGRKSAHSVCGLHTTAVRTSTTPSAASISRSQAGTAPMSSSCSSRLL